MSVHVRRTYREFAMAHTSTHSLTVHEKVKVVRIFSANGGNSEQTRKQLYQEGINEGKWGKVGMERVDLPSRATIIRVNDTFDETGCVDRTLLSVTPRINECIEANGGHFEKNRKCRKCML